jgi:hypothetical protein
MKYLMVALFLAYSSMSVAQNIIGVLTDKYALWDTTNLIYAKKLSEGIKGDSCIILGSVTSGAGSIWYKVATLDTVGYVMSDFVSYDKLKFKVKPKIETPAFNPAYQYFSISKIEWLVKRNKAISEMQIAEEKRKDELRQFLKKSELIILSHSFPKSDYLKYPGFKTTIVNPKEDKTIKYIWFTLVAFNPVDDVVGTKTIQAIGPVYPLKTADYSFEIVFKSSVIEYCKITNIKLQYMDGTTHIFNKSQVETIFTRSMIFKEYLNDNNL